MVVHLVATSPPYKKVLGWISRRSAGVTFGTGVRVVQQKGHGFKTHLSVYIFVHVFVGFHSCQCLCGFTLGSQSGYAVRLGWR